MGLFQDQQAFSEQENKHIISEENIHHGLFSEMSFFHPSKSKPSQAEFVCSECFSDLFLVPYIDS